MMKAEKSIDKTKLAGLRAAWLLDIELAVMAAKSRTDQVRITLEQQRSEAQRERSLDEDVAAYFDGRILASENSHNKALCALVVAGKRSASPYYVAGVADGLLDFIGAER